MFNNNKSIKKKYIFINVYYSIYINKNIILLMYIIQVEKHLIE